MNLRRATVEDAAVLARLMVDGVAMYRSFAPDGWEPVGVEQEIVANRDLLPRSDVWCLVAEDGGEVVGQIMVVPATLAGRRSDEPGLAHLRNLFVSSSLWGSGLAKTLHDAAVAEAGARGFTTMRLFVAAGQARARRFYEREGWAAVSEAFFEPKLGLDIIELRRRTG